MNREVVMLLFRQTWPDSTPQERRVVARTAGDLADAGQYRADTGVAVEPEKIITELAGAPESSGLIDRWNWWIESLDIAYGDYESFLIRRLDSSESD